MLSDDEAVVQCHLCLVTWTAHEDDVPSTARRHVDVGHPNDGETIITARLGGMKVYTLHRSPAVPAPVVSAAAEARPLPAPHWTDWLLLLPRTVRYLRNGGRR